MKDQPITKHFRESTWAAAATATEFQPSISPQHLLSLMAKQANPVQEEEEEEPLSFIISCHTDTQHKS